MAFRNKSYKKGGTNRKAAGAGKERRPASPRRDDPPAEDRQDRQDRSGYRGRGNGGGGGRGRGGDGDFEHITGLFESQNGNSWTVFAKPEHLDKLAEIKEGDLIGVTAGRDGRYSLWFMRK